MKKYTHILAYSTLLISLMFIVYYSRNSFISQHLPSSPFSGNLSSEIQINAKAEYEEWEKTGINSYRMQIQFVGGWIFPHIYDIVVTNGIIDSYTCSRSNEPSPCLDEILPVEDLTIQGLFKKLSTIYSDACWNANFDPKYHFPNDISYDCTNIFDEDRRWVVLSFEPKP